MIEYFKRAYFALTSPPDAEMIRVSELRQAKINLLEAQNNVEQGRIFMERSLVEVDVLISRIKRLGGEV